MKRLLSSIIVACCLLAVPAHAGGIRDAFKRLVTRDERHWRRNAGQNRKYLRKLHDGWHAEDENGKALAFDMLPENVQEALIYLLVAQLLGKTGVRAYRKRRKGAQ